MKPENHKYESQVMDFLQLLVVALARSPKFPAAILMFAVLTSLITAIVARNPDRDISSIEAFLRNFNPTTLARCQGDFDWMADLLDNYAFTPELQELFLYYVNSWESNSQHFSMSISHQNMSSSKTYNFYLNPSGIELTMGDRLDYYTGMITMENLLAHLNGLDQEVTLIDEAGHPVTTIIEGVSIGEVQRWLGFNATEISSRKSVIWPLPITPDARPAQVGDAIMYLILQRPKRGSDHQLTVYWDDNSQEHNGYIHLTDSNSLTIRNYQPSRGTRDYECDLTER